LQQSLLAEPGFDAAGVVVATVDLRRQGYDDERGLAFYRELAERLRAVPGISDASYATVVLLSGSQSSATMSPADDPERRSSISSSTIGEGYLELLRIPLVSGRALTAADDAGAAPVVVVNETLARQLWPDRNPLGQAIRRGSVDYEVVGVTRDGRYRLPGEPPVAHAFFATGQMYWGSMSLHVRSGLGVNETVAHMRAQLAALNPDIALERPVPLESLIATTMLPQRFAAWLVGAFGVLGLVLAGLGVYGVLAFQVAQRTRELGIRVVLGASTRSIVAMVVGKGARLAAVGVALGLAGAAAVTGLLQGMLYGVSPLDPVTFGGVALLLGVVALFASYLPAWRAARLQPLDALRQ
jgi:predicted permease